MLIKNCSEYIEILFTTAKVKFKLKFAMESLHVFKHDFSESMFLDNMNTIGWYSTNLMAFFLSFYIYELIKFMCFLYTTLYNT